MSIGLKPSSVHGVAGGLRREPVNSGQGGGASQRRRGHLSHTPKALGVFLRQSKGGRAFTCKGARAESAACRVLVVGALAGGDRRRDGRKVGRTLLTDLKSLFFSLWEPFEGRAVTHLDLHL